MRVAGNVARVGGYSLLVFIWVAIFCMYMLYFHNPNLNPVCPPPDLGDRYRIVPDLFDPECIFHSGVPHARASTPFQKMCTVECAPGYRMKRGFRFPEFSGGPVRAASKPTTKLVCVYFGDVSKWTVQQQIWPQTTLIEFPKDLKKESNVLSPYCEQIPLKSTDMREMSANSAS
eukprot:24431_1